MSTRPCRRRSRRRGAATVELAVLAPVLVFLFVIAVDYARVFHHSITVANCARNGALYASDSVASAESPYQSLEEATRADGGNLSAKLTVTSQSGTDDDGRAYVEVTVTYPFQTLVQYPGVPATVDVTRKVRMHVAPVVPN